MKMVLGFGFWVFGKGIIRRQGNISSWLFPKGFTITLSKPEFVESFKP